MISDQFYNLALFYYVTKSFSLASWKTIFKIAKQLATKKKLVDLLDYLTY